MDKRLPVGRYMIFLLWISCAIVAGCSLPSAGGEYSIEISAKTVTLTWDPSPIVFYGTPYAVYRYIVYIRHHGTITWRFIGSVPASENPSITINHADFGDGWYDFAVRATNGRGGSSPLHSSTDPTAQPFGGWFLKWNFAD